MSRSRRTDVTGRARHGVGEGWVEGLFGGVKTCSALTRVFAELSLLLDVFGDEVGRTVSGLATWKRGQEHTYRE